MKPGRRAAAVLLAAAATIPFCACSGVSSQAAPVAVPLAVRSSACDIEILLDKPSRAFEKITDIDVYVRRNKITGGQRAVYEEAVPELKKRGCEAGADAVLVKNQTVSQSGEWKLLYVGAVAIRYTR